MIFWISILVINGLATYLVAGAVGESAAKAMVMRHAEMLSMIDTRAGERYADLLRKLSILRRQINALQAFSEQQRSIEIHRLNGDEDMANTLLRKRPPVDHIEDWQGNNS